MRRAMLAATAALALAGAAGAQTPRTQEPERLQGTAWRVYYGFDAQGLGSSYTVQFDADGYARGPAVCTQFAIPYRQRRDRLTFGAAVSEAAPGCTGATAERDRRFIAALRSVRRATLEAPPASPGWSGPLLVLTGAGGRAVLQRATPSPPRDETRDERAVALSCDRLSEAEHPTAQFAGDEGLTLRWGRVGSASLRRSPEAPNLWRGAGHVFRIVGDVAQWSGFERDGGGEARCTAAAGDLTGGGPTDLRTIGRARTHRLELRLRRGLLNVSRGPSGRDYHVAPLRRERGAATYAVSRLTGGRVGTLTVRERACRDRLSGRDYPLEATLQLGGEILRSCGSGRADQRAGAPAAAGAARS